MAGPNLELFKFGLYLFFPLAVMVHYGDPEWYQRHVLPIRDQFWPNEETLYRPPRTSEEVKSSLAELRAQRLARKRGEAVGDVGSSAQSDVPAAQLPTQAAKVRLPERTNLSPHAGVRQSWAGREAWLASSERRLV